MTETSRTAPQDGPPPHVIGFAYECGAFDPALMRSGTSALVWNTARTLARTGHRVSLVTPAHGRQEYLRSRHGARDSGYLSRHTLPLELDPARWPDFPTSPRPTVDTRALHVRHDGVDLYFLGNEFLDAYPDTFYPAPEDEGADLAHCKPLVFQLEGVAFIREFLAEERAVVHAYEPLHHYLVPAAFADDPLRTVVSTVATNFPVNTGVYRPQLAAALAHLGARVDLDRYRDPPLGSGALDAALRTQLPDTRLDHANPPSHLGHLSLVVDHADGVDFLCEGQRDIYTTFAETPYEPRFRQLAISRVMAAHTDKQFVGGCGLSDNWLARDEGTVDRAEVLRELGLDPGAPTFYHAARYAVHHKGQRELLRAVERTLESGLRANFLIRCSTGTETDRPVAPADAAFQSVADRYPDQVRLDWRMVGEETLFRHAVAADFCLFPSKYELDTFLIAQGEAMACGAVPIATAQEGTRHFGHTFDIREPDATGFAVARSFQEDDPLLTQALVERIGEAVALFRDEPTEYARLTANARSTARQFTWERSTRLRAERFRALRSPTAARGAERTPPVPSTRQPSPRQPAGTAVVEVRDDRWSLRYTSREALHVEVFTPGQDPDGDCLRQSLRRDGETFQAEFPGHPPGPGVALLVTLPRGRFHWHEVPAPRNSPPVAGRCSGPAR